MTSKLKAIGSMPATGVYIVKFYYQKPEGGRDLSMPNWDIPARSYEHMQETVNAFNHPECEN